MLNLQYLTKNLSFYLNLPLINLSEVKKKGTIMQYNCFWPGTYSFMGELKLFATWLKNQMNTIMEKIEETESKLA